MRGIALGGVTNTADLEREVQVLRATCAQLTAERDQLRNGVAALHTEVAELKYKLPPPSPITESFIAALSNYIKQQKKL